MNIVLLTNGNIQAERILSALEEKSCVVQNIFIEKPQRVTDHIYYGERLSPWSFLKAIVRKFRNERRIRYFWRRLAKFGDVEWIPATNSPGMVNRLRSLSPDYIILGGIGILSEEVINVAKRGVLNAHPGILPWLRGVDVVSHAVLREVGLGASVHLISPHIDTGILLERKLISLQCEKFSLPELEDQCNQLAARLLSDVVSKIILGCQFDGVELHRDFKLCKRLTELEKRQVERKLCFSNIEAINKKFENLV